MRDLHSLQHRQVRACRSHPAGRVLHFEICRKPISIDQRSRSSKEWQKGSADQQVGCRVSSWKGDSATVDLTVRPAQAIVWRVLSRWRWRSGSGPLSQTSRTLRCLAPLSSPCDAQSSGVHASKASPCYFKGQNLDAVNDFDFTTTLLIVRLNNI